MKKISYLILTLAILLAASACSSQDATEEPTQLPATTLIISGSGSTTAILSAIADDFAADVPGYALQVLPGSGTGGGIEGILTDLLDVAAMGRLPNASDLEQGVEYFPIGQGAVGIFVHSGIEVDNLTSEQITAIYSGEIVNWSELGGSDLPIIVHTRDVGDSSRAQLDEFVFGEELSLVNTALIETSQSEMQSSVANTVGSIGYGTWPSARALDANVNPVALDGVAPTDGNYPMLEQLGIGYLPDRLEDVQPLIDWLNSDNGRSRLTGLGLILAVEN